MEDNVSEEIAIKINYIKDTYYDDNYIRKFKDTNLPLNGKYEDEDGSIHYYKNGKDHNENGPSYITTDGYKDYCINGEYHRIDGPAIFWPDGDYDWYINDFEIGKKTMCHWLIENDIPLDWNAWTDSDKMMFALHWSDYKIT